MSLAARLFSIALTYFRRGPSSFIAADLRQTLARIEAGQSLSYNNDGAVFLNREFLLPSRPIGYNSFIRRRDKRAWTKACRYRSGWRSLSYARPLRAFRAAKVKAFDLVIDISAFSFESPERNFEPQVDRVMRVPALIESKAALMAAFSRDLNFPAYFGANWDALSDCLHDLSWLSQRRIVILHSDLPSLGLRDILTYLEILANAVRSWRDDPARELIVVFSLAQRQIFTDLPERSKVNA